MTERKPPDMPVGSWVDRQVAEAQKRGEFDDLPGRGKPLPTPSGRDAVTDWAIQRIKTGDLDPNALLPPALALRRERQDLPERLARERSEQRVRELVEDLNERIRETYRRPQVGPAVVVKLVDVEEAVEAWRQR
ncbi:MAG TPA: DUF1992 domain-containing protein [Amycolatopsis sp.]|nr:DUF1992 domain-containing protein [Amycolatopsis sp.]